MIIINPKIEYAEIARQEWLKRKLEIDESGLPDYERPLFPMKKQKKVWSAAACYAFAGNIIRSVLP